METATRLVSTLSVINVLLGLATRAADRHTSPLSR
jgi:hypothetical protein